jgi:hypothetical protein
MEKVLSEDKLSILRRKGIISSEEIALLVGDLFVAENVSTRKRRVISDAASVLEESKRLLKG